MPALRVLILAVVLTGPQPASAQRLADLAPVAAALPSAAPARVPGDSAASVRSPQAGVGLAVGPARADTAARRATRSRRSRHARRGAVAGAVVGVGAALFVSHGLQEPSAGSFLDQRETWEAAGALGAAGALLGALLGALVP